jgi:Sec-independent protein secretion pathway component TatC
VFVSAAAARFRPLLAAALQAGTFFLLAWCALTFVPLRHDSLAELSTPLGGMQYSGAALALKAFERFALPPGTVLLLIGPFDALLAICLVGALLALLVTVPVSTILLARGLGKFVAKGSTLLRPRERAALASFGALAGGLFAVGFLVTFLLVVPAMFAWSAMLAPAVGATESVALLQFLSASFVISTLAGLSFEIPVLALVLARVGILTTGAMRRHWRGGVLGCFALALLISPGVGGGFLEAAFGLGLSGLLALAYVLVRRVEHRRVAREVPDASPA